MWPYHCGHVAKTVPKVAGLLRTPWPALGLTNWVTVGRQRCRGVSASAWVSPVRWLGATGADFLSPFELCVSPVRWLGATSSVGRRTNRGAGLG